MQNPHKKKYKIRFELTRIGLLGVGTLCVGIFLWMFFLGLWAGQTVLLPPQPADTEIEAEASAETSDEGMTQVDPQGADQQINEIFADIVEHQAEQTPQDKAFFTLQIGAFSTKERAMALALSWRDKGYETYYQAPGGEGDTYWRAFIGRFDELEDADVLAETLKNEENLKSFIAHVPAAKLQKP